MLPGAGGVSHGRSSHRQRLSPVRRLTSTSSPKRGEATDDHRQGDPLIGGKTPKRFLRHPHKLGAESKYALTHERQCEQSTEKNWPFAQPMGHAQPIGHATHGDMKQRLDQGARVASMQAAVQLPETVPVHHHRPAKISNVTPPPRCTTRSERAAVNGENQSLQRLSRTDTTSAALVVSRNTLPRNAPRLRASSARSAASVHGAISRASRNPH